jgi:hypothetical protein
MKTTFILLFFVCFSNEIRAQVVIEISKSKSNQFNQSQSIQSSNSFKKIKSLKAKYPTAYSDALSDCTHDNSIKTLSDFEECMISQLEF